MSMVDINIKGVLLSMAAMLPEFIAQKSGHIIVTSSIAGTKSVPGNAVYSGTKHFVRAMLDSFRAEAVMEGTNIRTTTIYPGAIWIYQCAESACPVFWKSPVRKEEIMVSDR